MEKMIAAVFLFMACPGAFAEKAGAQVEASTAAAKPRTVEDIYRGARYRDPFAEVSAVGGAAAAAAAAVAEWDPADFSIHELDLKGIMKDKSGAFAILTDRVAGVGFVLRGAKLYDFKNQLVAGVTGKINAAQKTVYLITADKDVQTLRLGEAEEDGS